MMIRPFRSTTWLLVLLAILFSGCAHSYHYAPEVAGDGAIWGGSGVIFSIPAKNPEIRMKMTSGGFEQAPSSAHLPSGTRVLVVRMAFKNTKHRSAKNLFFLDPKKQTLLLWDELALHPVLVHAHGKKQDRIPITGTGKQLIELLYTLPENARRRDVQSFSVKWSVSYGKSGSETTETQITRFDRTDSSLQGGSSMSYDPYMDEMDQAIVPPMLDDFPWWGPY